MGTLSVIFLFALVGGCQRAESEPDVWFVHAGELHLFLEPADGPDDEIRQLQERLNREALSALFDTMSSLLANVRGPGFMVLTGDFGIDPSWLAGTNQEGGQDDGHVRKAPREAGTRGVLSPERRAQANLLATLLRSSPVRDIYFVPGNNDIEAEQASEEALADAVLFFSRVRSELEGAGLSLHDLSTCYLGDDQPLSGCYADIPGTSFRLAGFPSYSFKNEGQESYDANREQQEKQVGKFASLIAQAEAQDRRVLVLSHSPELDDPFILAQERFAGKTPARTGNGDRPRFSGWNVSPLVFERWREIIESEAVVGILAGHFHDSHKEIYRRPYTWASTPDQANASKLFLAPPLSVKYQDRSPVQARGFSLVHLRNNEPKRRLYWYDAAEAVFVPDPAVSGPSGGGR